MSEPFIIGGKEIKPGNREIVEFALPALASHSELHIPVHVIRGKQSGPCLLVCAALHGDEINGIEIIRRLIGLKSISRLKGTLIAVPIMNIYGFIHMSRYLPDRRDLNRCFPGSEKGSLAGRLAHIFMQEIVSKATHGIDLHTAAVHRDNFPQIRANLHDNETLELAKAFQAPLIIDAALRPGTIREAAVSKGIPWLVYEAGEALRFDEISIRAGVRGIVNVMRELNMMPAQKNKAHVIPRIVKSNAWIRASQSGMLRLIVKLGANVNKGQTLAYVSDTYGETEVIITAPNTGIVIGRTNLPLVHEGDAVVHLALFSNTEGATEAVDIFQSELDPEEFESISGNDAIA